MGSGCHWDNNFDFDLKNVTFPFYNGSLLVNLSRNANDTYFEIHECGGSDSPWVYMLLTVLLIAACVGCCGFCFCSYCYKKQRGQGQGGNGAYHIQKKENKKKDVMKPLVINQEYN